MKGITKERTLEIELFVVAVIYVVGFVVLPLFSILRDSWLLFGIFFVWLIVGIPILINRARALNKETEEKGE